MLAIRNFMWIEDEYGLNPSGIDATALVHALASATGQFAIHEQLDASRHVLARDPLGVNKLFFTIDDQRELRSSNFLIDLVLNGDDLSHIWSVPSGHVLAIDTDGQTLGMEKYSSLSFGEDATDVRRADEYVNVIREELEQTFERLRPVAEGCPVYVTLSGGLDSSTILAIASAWLDNVTAVTFCLDSANGAPKSEDLSYARMVAQHLDIPLKVVTASPDDIVELLDTALTYGQDWRDFNVHCALVNAAIGRSIASDHSGTDAARPIVLTGDAMNELMADYSPVTYRGKEYYSLPRLSPVQLRRFLVAGLDSGDREVGIFSHFGLDTVQPYSLCANAYTSLPAEYVQDSTGKRRIAEELMGQRLPPEIYSRPKVRAQMGGAEEVRGTLAALVDRGLDGKRLLRRFSELFRCDQKEVARLIRVGFYRFPTEYPRE